MNTPEDMLLIDVLIPCMLSAFGWVMAYSIRRPLIFRAKLAITWTIPMVVATLHLLFGHSVQYLLLQHMFILMLGLLYWREIRELTTSAGYYKRTLRSITDIFPDMVWIKDLDNRFVYVNKAILDNLLLCDEKFALGKTGLEIATCHRMNGMEYTFGEVCGDSDEVTKDRGEPCTFLEYGKVNGELLALQVIKAPVYNKEGKMIGTVGFGRDMTWDMMDHERIKELLDAGKIDEARELFDRHMNRYKFVAGSTYVWGKD